MLKTILTGSTLLLATTALASTSLANNTYGPFPITVKGYSGDKKNSVSYSGQVARHVLNDSLKKLAGKGDGPAAACIVVLSESLRGKVLHRLKAVVEGGLLFCFQPARSWFEHYHLPPSMPKSSAPAQAHTSSGSSPG